MARGRQSTSFTEAQSGPSAAFPLAIPLEGVTGAKRADLAADLGVKQGSLAAIMAALSDPAGIRARVGRCPVLSAVALEILADVGGAAPFAAVKGELARRTGAPLDVAEKALLAAGLSLTCLFLSPVGYGQGPQRVALIDVCAGPVAALVRGLTLPRAAPPAEVPAMPSRDARDMIALIGLTAHKPLKLTQDGSPNGTSLKSLIKGTGLDFESADTMIQAAQRMGVLGESGEARARADALIAFAAGRAEPAEEARREAWLPRGRWVSVEAAQRALVALHHIDNAHHPFFRMAGADLTPESRVWMYFAQTSPWLDCIEHGGAVWLRRRPEAAGDGAGDGYVTPSFEVMLGPAAASDVVAEVALGCELTRVDHMLTFRLAPRSVEAGLAAGMDGASFLRALARVGPRGLPENVRAMVEDWIQSARLARVEQAVVVRVAARSEAALAGALGVDLLGRIGPGVLVVRRPAGRILSSPSEAEIAKRLAKIGYRVCAEGGEPPPPDEASDFEDRSSLPPSRAPRLTLWPEPDAELVKRLDAARANGLRAETELLSRLVKSASGASGGAPPQATRAVASAPPLTGRARVAERSPNPTVVPGAGGIADAPDEEDEEDDIEEAAGTAARMFPPCRAELERWMSRLPGEQRIRVHRTLDHPLFWAPYIALLPKYRDRVLSRARSVEDAVLDAWRLCDAARRHRQGSELMELARASGLIEPDWVDALDALHSPVDAAETLTLMFGRPRPASAPHARPAPAAEPLPAHHERLSSSTHAPPPATRSTRISSSS